MGFAAGGAALTASLVDAQGGMPWGFSGRGGTFWLATTIHGSLAVAGGTLSFVVADALEDGRHYVDKGGLAVGGRYERIQFSHQQMVVFVVLPFQVVSTVIASILASWGPSEGWLLGRLGPHLAVSVAVLAGGTATTLVLGRQARLARSTSRNSDRAEGGRRAPPPQPVVLLGLGQIGVRF